MHFLVRPNRCSARFSMRCTWPLISRLQTVAASPCTFRTRLGHMFRITDTEYVLLLVDKINMAAHRQKSAETWAVAVQVFITTRR